jgi:hypothetical protein
MSIQDGAQRYAAKNTSGREPRITEMRVTSGALQDGIDHYNATHPTAPTKEN